MKKQSKSSSRSGSDLSDNYSLPKKPPASSGAGSDRERMLERRRKQVSGVELCSCGGIIWNLGGVRKCGDCQQIIE